MDDEENVFVFRDDALTSEPTFEYEEDVRIDQVPVVIDNGKNVKIRVASKGHFCQLFYFLLRENVHNSLSLLYITFL